MKTGSASFTMRQVFDISPGQVCSLRAEPSMMRMRGVSLVWSCLRCASKMAARASSQSTAMS
jgi:hypothetical protein